MGKKRNKIIRMSSHLNNTYNNIDNMHDVPRRTHYFMKRGNKKMAAFIYLFIYFIFRVKLFIHDMPLDEEAAWHGGQRSLFGWSCSSGSSGWASRESGFPSLVMTWVIECDDLCWASLGLSHERDSSLYLLPQFHECWWEK